MSVDVQIRIDDADVRYVEGGLRVVVDGVPLRRPGATPGEDREGTGDGGDTSGDGYLGYVLDGTLRNVLSALVTVVRERRAATARVDATSLRFRFDPVDDRRVRVSIRRSDGSSAGEDSRDRRGAVVDLPDLCAETIDCARDLATACEAEARAQARAWEDARTADAPDLPDPAKLAAFDHPIRESIATLEAAVERRWPSR